MSIEQVDKNIGQVKWTLKKILWITIAVSCAIMFLVDPYNWIPEPDMSPCKKGVRGILP